LEYTTCTEAWLRVSVLDSTDHAGLRVYRDDSLVVNYPGVSADTVVIDTGLKPNTSYNYSTVRVTNGHEESPRDLLPITTLPLTTNNFIWTADTLGNWQYSTVLNDVAIIDQDNIWAVGDIATDSGRYNLAKWNGEQWRLEHVLGYASLRSIQYFSANDVWANSSYPQHWDGKKWTLYRLDQSTRPGVIQACWGTSSSNMYFVGNSGTIVHYDGTTFDRLESGTTETINDIWGSRNPVTGELTIYCAVTTLYTNNERRIVQIHPEGTVTDALQYRLNHSAMTIWFDGGSPVYLGGGGFFQYSWWTKHWQPVPDLPEYFVWDIAGNASNDILAVGAYGFLAHFNGTKWTQLSTIQSAPSFRAVDIQDDFAVILGRTANVILRGNR